MHDAPDVRDTPTSPTLPPILNLVHHLPQSEQRRGQFVPIELVPEALLQIADDELYVERQSPIAVVARVTKTIEAQLPRNDCGPEQICIEDRAALEAVSE